jgi:hypothetical protein
MTRLDYEKQNRKEQDLEPAEPGHMAAIVRHVRKRKAAQRYQARTFIRGLEQGSTQERDRILHLAYGLICYEHHKGCEHAACYVISNLVGYIKEGKK